MKDKTPKRHKNNSREQILRTAVVLFARQGFDRTGLRELSSEAGVNLAMINYFFGSKKRLLIEILDTFFSGYLETVTAELSGHDSVPVKLERFIGKAIAFFETNQDFLIIAITDLHYGDPEILEHKANWGRRTIAVVEREICHPLAKEKGIMIPPTMIASMLMSMMASRYLFSPLMKRLELAGQEIPSLEQYSTTITKLFLDGVFGLGNTDDQSQHSTGPTPGSTVSHEGEK